MELNQLIIYLGAFAIVAVAARKLAGVFQKFRLPLITGFLVIGLISGPEVLDLIERDALLKLTFINDIALAFIAFAVGSELYLNELRSRMKSIVYVAVTQMLVTFILVSLFCTGNETGGPFSCFYAGRNHRYCPFAGFGHCHYR
jgi:Kef-type K+ transport system membrane component KefB